jgi:hypothetical protein
VDKFNFGDDTVLEAYIHYLDYGQEDKNISSKLDENSCVYLSDGCLPVSIGFLTISNPNCLSSSETAGQSRDKKLEKALI